MKVQVYWNVRKKVWSVRHKGKVISHESSITLDNCKFTVQPRGRERVLQEKVKNVHAWVEGEWKPSGDGFELHGKKAVTYNPYKHDTFVLRDTGEPIHFADRVLLTSMYRPGDGKRPFVVV